jgi:hypothetical protein
MPLNLTHLKHPSNNEAVNRYNDLSFSSIRSTSAYNQFVPMQRDGSIEKSLHGIGGHETSQELKPV